ncbi:MAG: isoprenylcysteine carboxylmethyltransferase family protein [Candidatus Latescibacterota bacterium]|nr:MAG: isoprenylcysteine carboxylmethyltransferase family protein [Candidatus Latescibacterota bacterium]RKY73619.1 MAG: isoprenylcysteine carboxylmethyltransferase family protein [Candidatus Latescibacterota bacterium]
MGTLKNSVFRMRGYTPIPLLALMLILAETTPKRFIAGTALGLVGEAVRIWSVSYAGMETRTRKVGAPRLVTSGPYAHLRNPIYLGNFLLGLGFCLATWAWMPWMVGIYIAGFLLQYSLIISLEETRLRELFGKQYEGYAQAVPRFLPRLSPYRGEGRVKPNIRKALRSERDTFLSIAAALILVLLRWHLSG